MLRSLGDPPLTIESVSMQLALATASVRCRQLVCGDFALQPGLSVQAIDYILGGGPTVANSFHFVSVASDNYRQIKASAGIFCGCDAFSGTDEYPLFIKLFDMVGRPDPAGGDVPLLSIGVQAGEPRDVEPASGVTFTTGIAMLIVKGIQDTDDSPVANGDVTLDIFWT